MTNMALVPLSTKTALQRQFEVLADLLSPVDNNLSKTLKNLGRLFEGDATATILYLNRALKNAPRTPKESGLNKSIVTAPNEAVRKYLEDYDGLKDEIPQLVGLLRTIESKEDKVKEIVQSYEEYSNDPNKFWTSFSSFHAGSGIQQTVSAIEHHSSSSPLARRLLCRRLAAQIESKAQELEQQRHPLKPGMSYRDLALRLSAGENWRKHQLKLQEGERWSCLDPGVLPAIKGTNWKNWSRTSKVGLRAINEYLKNDPVTATYQNLSPNILAIQNCFGSTAHNCITPTLSLTNSDSQESVHPIPSVSPFTPTEDHREARTKRQRLCQGWVGDSRNGHRTRGRKRRVEYGRRGDREERTDTIEVHLLEPAERTSDNMPSQQEGPLNSSCDIEGPSQESYLTQRVDETNFPPQRTEQTAIHRRDAVQNALPPGAVQESMGNGIAITSLSSSDFSDRDLISRQPFPNSDPCWTFPNFDSGWTHDTWLSPFSNSDPNFFYSY